MDRACEPAADGGRRDLLTGVFLSGAFLLLYLRTLCPTVYLGDSGEIATAISSGGVVHPPGYPLFSLLGRIALLLVPLGEPAFRIGCLVAGSAALAIGALYLLIREVGVARPAAVVAAAGYGVSWTFWSQSNRVEVYSTHVLLAALTLLFAVRYRRGGCERDLLLAALCGSLGLAHHLTIVLLGPGLLFLMGERVWIEPGVPRRLGRVAAILAAAPLLYLLLLLWARQDPLLAWGYPTNLHRLWNHASARSYHGMLHLPSGRWLGVAAARAGAIYGADFAWGSWVPALVGARVLWRRDRGLALGFAAVLLAVTGYNFCYRIDDIAAYYLTAILCGFVFLAAGLDGILARTRSGPAHAALTVAAVTLLVAVPAARNGPACDLSGATWVREFARNKLESTERNTALLVQEDQDTFPLWYVRDALHVRPDVVLIDRLFLRSAWEHYPADDSLWYLRSLRRHGIDAPLLRPAGETERGYLRGDGYLLGLLRGPLRGRALAMTFWDDPRSSGRPIVRWAGARFNVVPVGLVYRLLPKTRPLEGPSLLAESRRLWDGMVVPDPRRARTEDEIDGDYLFHHYALMLVNLGRLYAGAGQHAEAERIYLRAAACAPRYEPVLAALTSEHRLAVRDEGR